MEKHAHRYSRDRDRDRRAADLAYQRPEKLIDPFTRMMAACRVLLVPGGVVVVTTHPYRTRGRLVDLPGQVAQADRRAGRGTPATENGATNSNCPAPATVDGARPAGRA
ncbi:hypothetical protein [Nocardiopsis tropica]|uniref:Uncharacterized protein n=1 Tax=Nocardiopsis tropica TaxID=109330 RepID=A0ABV2A3B9_9ACTN|nr:hypothetical protein [Nocardiopsis tropica]